MVSHEGTYEAQIWPHAEILPQPGERKRLTPANAVFPQSSGFELRVLSLEV